MLSPALEKERRQLFAQTVRHMGQRLLSVNEPVAMLAALRWGMRELDRTLETTPAKVKAKKK